MSGKRKEVWRVPASQVSLSIWTGNTGGGFIGGGFGAEGAALGMVGAALLNSATTEQYVMLAVVTHEWNGTVHELVLGFKIPESQLRTSIAEVLPSWGRAHVDNLLPRLDADLTKDQAEEWYEVVDIVESEVLFRVLSSTA